MQQLPVVRRFGAARRGKVLTQVVLPLAIFVAAVAGFTFVSQYGPGRGKPGDTAAPPPEAPPLKFEQTRTEWDPADPDFVAEYENAYGKPQNQSGHYHFLFRNPNSVPVDLGFTWKSCSCTQPALGFLKEGEAEVLTGPLGPAEYPGLRVLHLVNRGFGGDDGVSWYLNRKVLWTDLGDKYKEEGLTVPPGAAGVIRLGWKSSNRESARLALTVDLWAQLQGQPKTRKKVRLEGRLAIVMPLRNYPDKIALEDWSGDGARGEFYCWCATRPSFRLTARTDDPCVEVRPVRLTEDECAELERRMNERKGDDPLSAAKADYHKHIASAYRVEVNVYRRKDDHQLEQGHFQRWVRLKSPDVPVIENVQVEGYTPAEVTVEGEAERGKINLHNFVASSGTRKVAFLLVKPGVELLPAKTEKYPAFLDLKWQREKDAPGGQARWRLVVTVPGNARGTWPRDPALILHTRQEDQSEGRIRVPLLGNPYHK
jgi:hypothetical protein